MAAARTMAKRRRSVSQPSRVLFESQSELADMMQPQPRIEERATEESTVKGLDLGANRRLTRQSSLEIDLGTRMALIDKKLDWLTMCVIKHFDTLTFEVSKTQVQGDASRSSSRELPVPPPLSTPSQRDTQSNVGSESVVHTESRPTMDLGLDVAEPVRGVERTASAATAATRHRSHHDVVVEPVRGIEKTASVATAASKHRSSIRPSIPMEEAVQLVQLDLGSNQHPFVRAVWEILEDPESSTVARMYRYFEGFLIMLSVFGSLIKTMDTPPVPVQAILVCMLCLDAFFLLELSLRFFVCRSTRLFLGNASNLIDMVAGALSFGFITPCLQGTWECTGDGTLAMTSIVVMPLLRLMKSLRHFHQLQLFVDFAFDISEALAALLLLLGMIVLAFASIVYIVEPRENIPTFAIAMYFIVTTVSTVGYGDYSPESTIGYIVVSAVILVSIMFMALPLGIIGNSFSQIWAQRDYVLLSKRIKDRLKQWGYTARDMNTLITYFDHNNDGQLELHEFVNMIQQMGISMKHEKVTALFEILDTDAREAVDARKMTRLLFPDKYHELYPTSPLKPISYAEAALRLYTAGVSRYQTPYAARSFSNLFGPKESAVSPESA